MQYFQKCITRHKIKRKRVANLNDKIQISSFLMPPDNLFESLASMCITKRIGKKIREGIKLQMHEQNNKSFHRNVRLSVNPSIGNNFDHSKIHNF